MRFAFDWWAYQDLSGHADAILARLRAGTMPCDGALPEAQVDVLPAVGRRRPAGLSLD